MDRRRAAGLLLSLAACLATATAAPTASNHTALDLYDGAPEGCYYNFQHYGEGDRIMTNEPCLNCTCHNRMLMCYLRVCPFTKPIGQDCTIEKRADQCCPIVTCPDVPVDLLTSTTTSPAEYGPTGMGKLDKFGCSINGKYFSEGSKVPPIPNKPCEHCYCIRNMTTCVMQECTLHVDGCTPIYHKDVCCPVRYSCDHPEDEIPLLDDLSTTVRPTPGFLLTTTTISPVTQMSQDCVYDNRIFPDGALIKTEKACDHCYCMKGDIVCVVQECGTPMENEGKNCTALSPREGVCCPDTYICDGDEPSTGTYEMDNDFTTRSDQEKLTTLSPPRRTSAEGSGYRIEPDEVPYTDSPILEPEVEGSGDDEEKKQLVGITTEKSKTESIDDILASTEETHEFIPLTTIKPREEEQIKTEDGKQDETLISTKDVEKTTESQQYLPSTTGFYSTKDIEELITDKLEDIGSGEQPEDVSFKPHEEVSIATVLPDREENVATTEKYEQDIVTSGPKGQEPSEPPVPITSVPSLKEEKYEKPLEEVVSEISGSTTSILTIDTSTKTPDSTELSPTSEETATTDLESSSLTTYSTPISDKEVKETTKSTDLNAVTRVPGDFIQEGNLETQHYLSSTSSPSVDDEFVTTETQEVVTDRTKETEYFEPQHVTASTPLLEEIEKDTTEYTETEHAIPSVATQDSMFDVLSTTISNIPAMENDKKVTKSPISEEHEPEDYPPGTSEIPVLDQREQTTASLDEISEGPVDTSVKESSKPEEYSPSTITSDLIDKERKTTAGLEIAVSEYDGERHETGSSTTTSTLETEEVTTEPDKGLNTIPSEGIEEDVSVSPEEQKPTLIEDKITTEADNIISSTISDKSVSREEQPLLTTESAFRKEDHRPTETQMTSESTTVAASVTEEVISTLTHDHTKSTESIPDSQHETDTTLEPKYTQSIEETTLAKETSDVTIYEPSTSEASFSEMITEKATTSIPLHEKETTTANQEENEIFNEPRIPGEGDCLLNGVTYTNESDVPSTNKCQSGCKCVSSIIKCDPIICSPPPEYMDNCETVYDNPDACCPTYICDHKTETIPPQSHSQMSGTEAPVILPVHCHGDECEISKDQKHHDESPDACKSGSCAGPSDESKETLGYPHSENIPEKTTIVQGEECVGSECQATPVQPCEGKKCETLPEVMLPPEPQQCADGENCEVFSIPSKECIGNNCADSQTHMEDTHPTQLCTEEGCINAPLPEDECKDDHCRRKDSSPLDQHVSKPCTTPDCKPTQTDIETSATPTLEQTSESIDEDKNNDVTETTSKIESLTESPEHKYSVETPEHLETHEIVTKQPDTSTSDESVPDIIELVTKLEPEITTKPAEHIDKQGVTSGEFVTERKESLFTESPEYQSSVSAETTKKDSIEDSTLRDIEIEMTDKSITPEEAFDTERPQEFVPTEKTMATKISDITEPTMVFTSEAEVTIKPTKEIKPGDDTPDFTEKISTEKSPVSSTMETQETTKPSIDITDKISTDIIIDISTITPTSQYDIKKPGFSDDTVTTVTLAQESNTEPSRMFATELDGVTGDSQETEVTEPTGSIKDDKHTEVILQTTSEPIIIDSDEHVGEPDHTKPVSETLEYDVTTVSGLSDDMQSITVSDSPDITALPEQTKHKDTPSDITEKTVTEPTKAVFTDSLETTQSSESFSQEVTTRKSLEKTTIESYYTEEQQYITPYQEVEKTTMEVHESVTVSPKTTDAQFDTKSPEEIEREGMTDTGIETTHISSTKPKVPDEYIYHEQSTLKVTEESSSEPPTAQLDHKNSTPNLFEESSETSVTASYVIPEEIDQKNTSSEIPDKSGNKPINIYPVEQEEENKSPLETDHETMTDNILDEFVTEPPKSFDIEPDIPNLPAEETPSKISQETELPSSYTMEPLATSKTSEESATTTVNSIAVSASEPSKVDDTTEKIFTASEVPEIITTSQEYSTSKSDELTTATSVSDSKIATPQEEISKETTDTDIYSIVSKPPQAEEGVETEPSVKEEVNTTPVSTYHDIITPTSQSVDYDHTQYAVSSSETTETETQKTYLETQTIPSEISASEKTPQPDSTKQPEEATATEKEVPQQIDTEIQEPTFIATESDEQTYDLTTSKYIETSQIPHDIEVKTELPEISSIPTKTEQEQSTENILPVSQKESTEEISTGTEKLAKPEEASTDKPVPTRDADSTKEIESGTEPLQESYTEEPISKHSSPEPSPGYDSTKINPDDTVEPVYQDSKEPEKPIDDFIQSLVTESYEIDTKPSDIEKDSQSQVPTQTSTATPDYITEMIQTDNIADKLSTPSSLSIGTTLKEIDNEVSMSTELYKPIEDIRTESPSHTDITETKTTTQKKFLLEDSSVTQQPSEPEENEIVTNEITEQKLTTEHADMVSVDVTTEEIAQDISLTEKQELLPSDKPSFDLHETLTESPYTTETSDKHTVPTLEVTKVSDVPIETEISETVSTESPQLPSDVEVPTLKPVSEEHGLHSEDQKKQSESTTLEPITEAEISSSSESSIAPKQELPEGMNSPSDEIEKSDKITKETTKTLDAGEFTTEGVTSVHYTEKQPEILQTVTPEKATPIEEYVTTRKQLEPEVYQTTSPAAEIINEMSTRPSVSMDEESTTLANDIVQLPTDEQSIHVVISETEKASTPQESIAVQTERVIAASEKPIKETTAPEEEFIIATPQATTAKTEEEIFTLSPPFDRTVKPMDTHVETYTTTAPDASITVASEGPISGVPEEPATTAQDAFATSSPETLVTKIPEGTVATESAVFITKASEVPVTSEPEVPATKTPEEPFTNAPEVAETPVTTADISGESITNAPDAYTTTAPEVPSSSEPKVPETPVSGATEAPITNVPEVPEHITKAPEVPITSAPEEPITSAPENTISSTPEEPISSAPEEPMSSAPEEPISIAPEEPTSSASEVPIKKAPEESITSTPEEPITRAPEIPISSAPEESISSSPKEPITSAPEGLISSAPEEPITRAPEEPIASAPEEPITNAPEEPISRAPEEPFTRAPEEPITSAPEDPITSAPEEPISSAPEEQISSAPEKPITKAPEEPITNAPEEPITKAPEEPITNAPEEPITKAPEEPISRAPEEPNTRAPEEPITSAPEEPISSMPEEPITKAPEEPITRAPEEPITRAPEEPITNAPEEPISSAPEEPISSTPEEPITKAPEEPITSAPEEPISSAPEEPISSTPEEPITKAPEESITSAPEEPISSAPEEPISSAPEKPISSAPEEPISSAPEDPISSAHEEPISSAPEEPTSSAPEAPITKSPEAPITSAPEIPITNPPELPVTAAPELPKPVSTEAQPTEEALTPDEEGSFPPSGGTSGYGQEPDYVEEDQTFGPGTCRYGGKVYVSAQQIPRDDPCDFCFCFRSDIICLQQSCPPPIHGCHEEPIQGFCCPRYECPVSMATTVNVTTTTTTTTTTLPPHFPTHSYKGHAQKRGCQIKGQTYKVGEVVRASSGPCLHCTCGGDGQMKCDPKVCTPEPMLRQMIAAAVSAKRRR